MSRPATTANCIRHTDRPAVGHCYQCHKPLCKDCRYPGAPDGLFCGQACYDQYLAYQARKQPVVKESRLKSLAIGVLLLAAVAAAVVIGGKMGVPVLKDIYKAIAR
jgi:hypothetical protein